MSIVANEWDASPVWFASARVTVALVAPRVIVNLSNPYQPDPLTTV